MEANGVAVDSFRAVDHDLAPGVYPDMTRARLPRRDEWPEFYARVQAADILVVGTPIWLGEKSSVCTRLIERLYGNSSQLNEQGQYAYYGKVGGCLVTGNEDGVKHCAMNVLYSLQHLGYLIPPQADAGWIGEAGPGPSYLDPGSGGPENDFTNRNTTFMTWNLMHVARLAEGCRRLPGARQPTRALGRRMPLRLRQPGVPLNQTGRERPRTPHRRGPGSLSVSPTGRRMPGGSQRSRSRQTAS